jgi:hypothetical protein
LWQDKPEEAKRVMSLPCFGMFCRARFMRHASQIKEK